MKVVILFERWCNDDGREVIGVYATEELADLEISARTRDDDEDTLSRVTYSVGTYEVVTDPKQIR